MKCHGCGGKGWVDSEYKGACMCPICKGGGQRPESPVKPAKDKKIKYDQDDIWVELRKNIPAKFGEKLAGEIERIQKEAKDKKDPEVIVHLLFDKAVVPQGNLIFHHLSRSAITLPSDNKLSNDELVARGYVPIGDGKVETVHDVPISPVYSTIRDWLCMENSFAKTWKLDPNRKGMPYFSDENMMAFMVQPKRLKVLDIAFTALASVILEKHSIRTTNIALHLLP
jgi:hypothetical protein